MPDYLTRDIPRDELAETLKTLGNEGWSLVNCWPTKKGAVSCVLRRDRLYYNDETDSYEPSHPLDGFTAETALKTCLAAPVFRRKGTADGKFTKSIPLSRLAAKYGVSEEAMAVHLREIAGFTPSTTTPNCFATVVGDCDLWIHRSRSDKPWILYAKKGEESEAGHAPDPAAVSQFSVVKAIELCEQQPLKGTHQDHSLDLARAAGSQGTTLAVALAAFKQVGLPAPGMRHKILHERLVLLRPWIKNPNKWFLCVRNKAASSHDEQKKRAE
jgi:hypothetical protein